jgi:hypothetical protein
MCVSNEASMQEGKKQSKPVIGIVVVMFCDSFFVNFCEFALG